jgi:hypothetical protein
MVGNLDLQQIAEASDDKEILINAATLKADRAITDWFDADMTSGSVALTLVQFQENIFYRITNATVAARTLTVQASKRLFAVSSDSANTQDVDLVLGTTTITLSPGDSSIYYTDGTANGLEAVAGGGGASTFLGLTDTPSSYSGQAGKAAVVNSGGTALEFGTVAGGSGVQLTRKSRGALVHKSTDQTSISSGVWTASAFDVELYDTDNFHDNSTNNSRFTIPAGVSKVQLVGQLLTSAIAANLELGIRISKNGAATNEGVPEVIFEESLGSGLNQVTSAVLEVVEGDYFELEILINVAGEDILAAVHTWFGIEVKEDADATDVQSVAIGMKPPFRGAMVKKNANQSMGNATWDELTWQVEDFDTDDFHDNSTNNERFTIPAGIKKVRLSCGIFGSPVVAGEDMGMRFYKNGAAVAGGGQWNRQEGFNSNSYFNTSGIIEVVEGDYLTVEAIVGAAGETVNSGDNTWFCLEVIEDDTAISVPTGFIAIQPQHKGALLGLSANQTGLSAATWTPITWGSVTYDTELQPDDTGQPQRFWLGADLTFTADHTTEQFTATAHGMVTGEGPFRVSTTTTLPAGLGATTDYWCIRISANVLQFATSRANAIAGTAVAITDNGTGTHTLERETWAVVPAGVSKVRFTGGMQTSVLVAGDDIGLRVAKNEAVTHEGVTQHLMQEGTATGYISISTPVLEVTEGDRLELEAYISAASEDIIDSVNTYFSIEVVEESKPLSFPGVTVERPHIGCHIDNTTSQPITTGGTGEFISMDAEEYDTGYRGVAFHDTVTNNTRITIPAGVVKVQLTANAIWESSATGARQLGIRKNGSPFGGEARGIQVPDTAGNIGQNVTTGVITVSEGDYFELWAAHTHGSDLDILADNVTWFAMTVVETDEAAFVPEQVETFLEGVPTASNDAWIKVAHRRFSLADNFADSQAFAVTAPSSAMALDVERNGTKIGEIQFAASATTATFTTTAATEEAFEVGDYLTIVTPSNLFTAADIAISLKAWRS